LYFGVKTAINSYKNTLLTQGQPKRPIIIETKQDDFVINVTPKNFAQINKTKESFELNQTGLIADQPQIHKQDVLNEKSLLETIESLSVQNKIMTPSSRDIQIKCWILFLMNRIRKKKQSPSRIWK
jgi:hypothetical protein